MMSKGQIRAALAWLKLTGKDLAEEVGMSANAMNTFLREEKAGTTWEKLKKIESSLSARGIEFVGNDTVRNRNET